MVMIAVNLNDREFLCRRMDRFPSIERSQAEQSGPSGPEFIPHAGSELEGGMSFTSRW
jgi:hypothetical protein